MGQVTLNARGTPMMTSTPLLNAQQLHQASQAQTALQLQLLAGLQASQMNGNQMQVGMQPNMNQINLLNQLNLQNQLTQMNNQQVGMNINALQINNVQQLANQSAASQLQSNNSQFAGGQTQQMTQAQFNMILQQQMLQNSLQQASANSPQMKMQQGSPAVQGAPLNSPMPTSKFPMLNPSQISFLQSQKQIQVCQEVVVTNARYKVITKMMKQPNLDQAQRVQYAQAFQMNMQNIQNLHASFPNIQQSIQVP
jgi:hypothetical protein